MLDPFERSCVLASDVTYRGIVLPAGSAFRFDLDFNFLVVTLERATRVHWIEAPRGSDLVFQPLFDMLFAPGLLLWPWILAWGIAGARRGHVEVRLASPVSLQLATGTVECHAGESLQLDERQLHAIHLESPRTIGRHRFEKGTLWFDRDGQVRGCNSAAERASG